MTPHNLITAAAYLATHTWVLVPLAAAVALIGRQGSRR